jgi:hypothetical protein
VTIPDGQNAKPLDSPEGIVGRVGGKEDGREGRDREWEMNEVEVRELVQRYIALWVESDAEVRRKGIEELWAQDGSHVLQPPAEIREAAAALGFEHSTLEAHGHDEIERRVSSSYERFVATGEYTFRPLDNAVRLHDVVKFGWATVDARSGEEVGGGLEVLVLDSAGKIKEDYMFPGA